jgi:hypothetical protein
LARHECGQSSSARLQRSSAIEDETDIMSDENVNTGRNAGQTQDSDNDPERAGQVAEKPEPDESAKQKAKEMTKAYDDEVTTAVLPGSGGTITGTAINEWLDDDGNPKYGKEGEKAESKSEGDG